MVENINRRDFLKISGATVVGGMAALNATDVLKSNGKNSSKDKEKIVPSICEMCFWRCGILVHVKNGKAVKITGNPKHPLSNGKLCPRGTGGLGNLYDPDRLKQPLIRVRTKIGKDKKGKPTFKEKWKPASWDEALQYTAKRLLEIRKEHGPEKLAMYSHGSGGAFFKPLLKALGSGLITAPSYDQCRGPRSEGFYLTYGQTVGSPERLDVANTKCIAFIGAHLGENMHNTAVQDMSDAVGNGAIFITVDPRFSTVAGKSKYWLPIKPATDIALLQAWANVMIKEGIYQKEFIKNNAYGFNKFKKFISDKTPEWAYPITGIEPDVIRKTARDLAKNAPASLIHPGRHVVWYGDDTQRSRMIALVNALLGNWNKKGGFYMVDKFPVKKLKHKKYPKLAIHFDEYPLAKEALAKGICDASAPSPMGGKDEKSIRAWLIYSCNVPCTLPNPKKTIEVMKNLDFIVAIDTMPAEVTALADVVLPECTYLERYDNFHNPSVRSPYVAIRQPTVKPLAKSKPGWWIAKELAKHLDRENKKLNPKTKENFSEYFPWKTQEEHLKLVAKKSKMDFAKIKKEGVLLGEPAVMYSNEKKMTFNTPSKKIEFYSKELEEYGQDPIPHFTKHDEPPEGYFRLLFGRAPLHTFTRTTNNRVLLDIFPTNEVWLNSDMAKINGVKNGEFIYLINQDGVKSNKVRAKVTERIRQDCVFMVHGFGRLDKRLTASYMNGGNDSCLISRVKRDPIMGGTGMNVNFVTIVKV